MADTLNKLICPACGENMTKVFIKDAGVNIDICLDGCGGILFDNRELEKFDEVNENADEILSAIEGKTFREVDESASRDCPVCGVKMLKMGAGSGGVQLDCCSFCGVKFLDNGELQKIRTGNKESIDKGVSELLDNAFADQIENVTFGLRPQKTSPRRQFVENFIRKFV